MQREHQFAFYKLNHTKSTDSLEIEFKKFGLEKSFIWHYSQGKNLKNKQNCKNLVYHWSVK